MPGAEEWPTVAEHPRATGAHHEVAPGELFFSTTDRRGVITDANSVFVRLSRHPREELIGAPHSIIRNPAMPAGAFKLMWDTLAAGRPFCAYVDNLAADGSAYTVFATVTPIDGGYLSVRGRPMCADLDAAAHDLYLRARPVELGARGQGASAREAAAIGLGSLASGLAEAGIGSYDDFVCLALPAEMEARERAGITVADRPLATGPITDILRSAQGIGSELTAWSGRQLELARLADALVAARGRLDDTMTDAKRAAERFAAAGAGEARLAPVLLTVTVWAQMMDEIAKVVAGLADSLEALRASCAQTRFRVALAQLHADTVGQFAAELIDAGASAQGEARRAAESIGTLCRALHLGFDATAAQTRANADLSAATVAHLRDAHDLIAMPRDLMENWKQQVAARADLDPVVVALLPEVDEQLRRTDEALTMLASLADQCAGLAEPQRTEGVEAELARIARAGSLLTGEPLTGLPA